MRTPILLFILFASLPAAPQAAAPSADARVLPAGTVVRLRTTQSADSKHYKSGDPLALEVMRDVKIGDLLVIAKHTPVMATLARAQRAGRGLRPGSFAIEIDSVNDIKGQPVAVSGTKKVKGNSDEQFRDSMQIFFLSAPFIRGGEAEIPRGTEFDPVVRQDVVLDVPALTQHAAALAAEHAAAGEKSRTGQATVHFYFPFGLDVHHSNMQDHLILLDGQKLVRLRNWRYYDTRVAPGHHTVGCNGQSLDLELKADQDYYVRVVEEEHAHGFLRTHWVPQLADPEVGEEQMYPLYRTLPRDIYSGQPNL